MAATFMSIKPGGISWFESFGELGRAPRKATFWGKVAPLVGKQPPDTHVWFVKSEAPAFIESEGPRELNNQRRLPSGRIRRSNSLATRLQWAESRP